MLMEEYSILSGKKYQKLNVSAIILNLRMKWD